MIQMAISKIDLGTGNSLNVELAEDAGSTFYEVTDSNGTVLFKVLSDGTIDMGSGSVYNNSVSINAQTGTTYTLQSSDLGKVITLNNASAITLTVPDALSAGFHCTIIQIGAGQVTVAGGGSMTLRNRQSHTKLAGQYAMGSLYIYAPNNVALGGDTAS